VPDGTPPSRINATPASEPPKVNQAVKALEVAVESLLNDYEMVWPPYGGTLAAGGTWEPHGSTRWGDGTPTFWGTKDGLAGDGMTMIAGRLAGFLSMGGGAQSGRPANGASLYPLLQKPVSPGFVAPRGIRVWRFRATICRGALINWTPETGLALLLGAGVTPGWLSLGNCGMGLLGDGAGGWRYASRKVSGGPYTEQVPLAWPAAQTEWVNVVFEIVSANPATEAVFNLYIGDATTPVISRPWGVGTLLPDYSNLANSARFVPYARAGDAALSNALCIAHAVASAGRLTILGQEG
jgi:hypothetical protein